MGCATGGSVDVDGLTATACYLGSAAVVATTGHALRWNALRAEVHWRCALEAEQATTLELVGELRRLSTQDSLTGLANRGRGTTTCSGPATAPPRAHRSRWR